MDSHLAVVAGAVILAHEDVEKRTETFVEMLGKGELAEPVGVFGFFFDGCSCRFCCCREISAGSLFSPNFD